MLGRAGHDLVHDRFCVQLMVSAVQELYDEGARAVRPTRGDACGRGDGVGGVGLKPADPSASVGS